MDNEKSRIEYLQFIKNKDFFSNPDLSKDILDKFGPPPYYYLKPWDPIPVINSKRKTRNILSLKHTFEVPGPNYRSFKKAEYIDSEGREYKIADGPLKTSYIDDGTIKNFDFKGPIQNKNNFVGSQLLWSRIPISTRNLVKNPSGFASGEQLNLIHIETQIPCTCIVNKSIFKGKMKTGWVLVDEFYIEGEKASPKLYKKYINKIF